MFLFGSCRCLTHRDYNNVELEQPICRFLMLTVNSMRDFWLGTELAEGEKTRHCPSTITTRSVFPRPTVDTKLARKKRYGVYCLFNNRDLYSHLRMGQKNGCS
jgi:hypothetical protein